MIRYVLLREPGCKGESSGDTGFLAWQRRAHGKPRRFVFEDPSLAIRTGPGAELLDIETWSSLG